MPLRFGHKGAQLLLTDRSAHADKTEWRFLSGLRQNLHWRSRPFAGQPPHLPGAIPPLGALLSLFHIYFSDRLPGANFGIDGLVRTDFRMRCSQAGAGSECKSSGGSRR